MSLHFYFTNYLFILLPLLSLFSFFPFIYKSIFLFVLSHCFSLSPIFFHTLLVSIIPPLSLFSLSPVFSLSNLFSYSLPSAPFIPFSPSLQSSLFFPLSISILPPLYRLLYLSIFGIFSLSSLSHITPLCLSLSLSSLYIKLSHSFPFFQFYKNEKYAFQVMKFFVKK